MTKLEPDSERYARCQACDGAIWPGDENASLLCPGCVDLMVTCDGCSYIYETSEHRQCPKCGRFPRADNKPDWTREIGKCHSCGGPVFENQHDGCEWCSEEDPIPGVLNKQNDGTWQPLKDTGPSAPDLKEGAGNWLFVYGTLLTDEVLASLLPYRERWASMVPGRLHYVQDSGGFPVMVPPTYGTDWVYGELVEVDYMDDEVQAVLALESAAGYDVRWVEAVDHKGERQKALAFVWPWKEYGNLIIGGDWKERNGSK